LRFITAAMWDGRETHAPFLPPQDAGVNEDDLFASLSSQAIDAVASHAQGTVVPTPAQVQQIIEFEMGLSTAQIFDNHAGYLNDDDAIGGPRVLFNQQFYVGFNDVLGADPAGNAFVPAAMRVYAAWEPGDDHGGGAQASIARGEELFNSKPISITGVGGLNDALGMPVIAGTCTTCHDAPNVGNHSVALPIDIGLTDASRRTPDLPLYTLRNNSTGETRQTTDPGRALVTGKWADVGKFKGPILRGLAARAPYFHNGFAASLSDAIDFYDTRFNIGFSKQEKQDLIAFLSAL
jgi:cytochrome c peroxidase